MIMLVLWVVSFWLSVAYGLFGLVQLAVSARRSLTGAAPRRLLSERPRRWIHAIGIASVTAFAAGTVFIFYSLSQWEF